MSSITSVHPLTFHADEHPGTRMHTSGISSDEVLAIATVFRALAHPIRIRVLVAFRESNLSPAELDRLLADPTVSLSALSYHVRGLARTGLIELTGVRQRRNAIEHRYALTARGRTVVRALQALEPL